MTLINEMFILWYTKSGESEMKKFRFLEIAVLNIFLSIISISIYYFFLAYGNILNSTILNILEFYVIISTGIFFFSIVRDY